MFLNQYFVTDYVKGKEKLEAGLTAEKVILKT